MSQESEPTSTAKKTPADVRQLILSAGSRPFVVEFTKRSTGALRTMRAKLGPHKGGQKSLDMGRNGLLAVIDLDAGGWRSIPLDAVTSFRFLKG